MATKHLPYVPISPGHKPAMLRNTEDIVVAVTLPVPDIFCQRNKQPRRLFGNGRLALVAAMCCSKKETKEARRGVWSLELFPFLFQACGLPHTPHTPRFWVFFQFPLYSAFRFSVFYVLSAAGSRCSGSRIRIQDRGSRITAPWGRSVVAATSGIRRWVRGHRSCPPRTAPC